MGAVLMRLHNRCVYMSDEERNVGNVQFCQVIYSDIRDISFAIWVWYIQIGSPQRVACPLWNSGIFIPSNGNILSRIRKSRVRHSSKLRNCILPICEIGNFNIKYFVSRTQVLQQFVRLHLNVTAYISCNAKLKRSKMINACVYACFSLFLSFVLYLK